MKANSSGECEIKTGNKSIKIIVTDIIEKPTYHEQKKEIVPCNQYNKSEAELLDKLLAFKINESGYQTRAGAVEAARFLTLEFKYRIPYFYEMVEFIQVAFTLPMVKVVTTKLAYT